MEQQRQIQSTIQAHRQTEGGGFVVRRPFPAFDVDQVDPFLLLDEFGPSDYGPGEALGAPDHPHRGFETVTYMLEGEFVHEDSAGHRGVLGPGDVQWMTAGDGVVHSEMPSERIRREGGRIHGFQIWVNLPKVDKRMAPRYQEISADRIPKAVSTDGRTRVTVVAGTALGVSAVIETRTPIVYQDWSMEPGADHAVSLDSSMDGMVYVFGGEIEVGGRRVVDGTLALLGPGESFQVRSVGERGARFLLLGGTPLREPVVRYGPFVMNTREEIHQAIRDAQSGRLGRIER